MFVPETDHSVKLKLPSDLRALYQTSKELNKLLIHRVFKKISINVRDAATVNDFVCSMVSDDSSKLRHCRVLNLWDGYPPTEALSMSPSLLKLLESRLSYQVVAKLIPICDALWSLSYGYSPKIACTHFGMLFTNAVLTLKLTCKSFVSVRFLDSALFSIILKKQGQSLNRVQASSTDPRHLCLPRQLKDVDFWLLGEPQSSQAGRLSCLKACPKLEELCLTTVKDTMVSSARALRSLLESKYE